MNSAMPEMTTHNLGFGYWAVEVKMPDVKCEGYTFQQGYVKVYFHDYVVDRALTVDTARQIALHHRSGRTRTRRGPTLVSTPTGVSS
jgi:hypothetical protein